MASDPVGQALGHYEIERHLGRGATGDVYAARDARSGRVLALKILAPHLVDTPAQRQRLYAEGLLAASLDHPGICRILEIGEAGGRAFVAMELVEGQTLDAWARQETLTLARILDLAMQLAEALDAAHRHGVVHRDLNSRNIVVGSDGRATILDFGLAHRPGAGAPQVFGVGAADYASPEQVTGRDVDARSDLFSLGVVLHELLTGRLPFQGENRTELFRAIVNNAAVPVDQINDAVPIGLSNVVGRLLAKNRERRYQSAADVLAALRPLAAPTPAARAPQLPLTQRRWFARLAGSAAGIVLAVGALFPAAVLLSYEAQAALRTTTAQRSGVWIGAATGRSLEPAIVATEQPGGVWVGDDGRLIYAASGAGNRAAVWMLAPGAAGPRLLAADALSPSVTADGRAIVFAGLYDQGLYRLDTGGGDAVRIGTHRAVAPTVLADGSGVVFRDAVTGLVQIAPLDGRPAHAVTAYPIATAPFVSPDGRRVAFEHGGQTVVCDLPRCAAEHRLAIGGLRGWAPDGTGIAYAGRPRGANIWIVPVDGGPARQVTWFDSRSISSVAWSPDGSRLAVTRVMTLSDFDLLSAFR